ncbi:MAG: aminotransferase class IV [Anaerolineae bacterium]|nr:aminotransferase class IV [Anaerolineae bacterium]
MSPCYIQTLTSDGLHPVAYTADSLADAARHEPHNGVYTVTNTYQTFKVLKLDAHLDRLEDSARRENIPLNLNRTVLRAALRSMIAAANYGDVRFRITVPHDQPDHLILSIEPFSPPAPEVYANGVHCITLPNSARHNPAAKTTDWMHDRESVKLPDGIYTGLLLDHDDNILEGVSSNFYAVLNGELRTAGEGVLLGIAQQIVFEVASGILPLRREAVNINDLSQLSDAFITSSSRGIVPVVEIDGLKIGEGRPGSYTHALRQAYVAWVESHLEEL